MHASHRANDQRIKLVVVTRHNEANFWQQSALGQSWHRIEWDTRFELHVVCENKIELAELYNRAIYAADAPEHVVFVRDDVWLDDLHLAQRILDGLETFDVIGVAGNTRRTAAHVNWRFLANAFGQVSADEDKYLRGSVAHGEAALGKPFVYGATPAAVECLDGVLLGVRRSMVIANNVTFDSSLQSDFCNTDFCRSALLAGLTIGTWPIAITYKSDVLLDDSEWHEQLKIYRKKWSDHIEPDASSCFAQGNKLIEANEPQLAIPFYEQTIALNPLHSNAHFNLGLAYAMQNFYHLALPHFEHGVSLMPDASVYIGNVLNAKMRLCDWRDLQTLIEQIESRVLAGQRTCPPFQIISFSGSPDMQRKAASLWVEAYPALPNSNPFLPTQKQAGEKIRIAYFSADFRNHPVAYLTAEMFELHDKTQFELIAFSNGHAPQGDPYRARVVAAFDQFIDIRTMSDEAVVQLARQMKIDVAVDLTSLTQGGRTSILMARVAPVQMHYLGYPATTSAANVDYMIADEMLAPKAMQQHYSEKMLYLPHCFQVSDRYRPAASPISDRSASRMALGLPKGNFVFCSFCNSYKITPEVFDSWMRILQAAPQSVLMLYADSEAAQSNLRREAQARDVDANRLVFGTRVGVPDYLARLTNCDLFLDTLPYNGGTTANDALWMGLPLLTMTGETMTSRMAASLLHTLDLDELIATNWSDYEKKAVQLATQPARYTAIKQHLLAQREVSPLFDTTRTTRHIEHGYCLALERYWQGLAPDHLYVPA